MRRRDWLALIGGSTTVALTGCSSSLDQNCTTPQLRNELQYDQRTPTAIFADSTSGIRLITSSNEIGQFDSDSLGNDIERWVQETAFENNSVVGFQVGSARESSPIEILGVERDGTTVTVHSCIENQGSDDVWVPYAKVLRIPFGDREPESARLSHREGGETQVFE